MVSRKKIRLYTDGGSRGNPGMGACAYVICNDKNEIISTNSIFLGYYVTNNEAEYAGIINGLIRLQNWPEKANQVDVFSDSKLCVNCITGVWRAKKTRLKELKYQVIGLTQALSSVKFHWVSRETSQIMLADSLVNQKINANIK